MNRLYYIVTISLLIIHIIISYIFVNFCIVNTGFSFGLMNNIDLYQSVALNLIPLTFLFIVVVKLGRDNKYHEIHNLLMIIIFAGSLNLVDRLIHGGVCDYIFVHKGLPISNLNDVVILGTITKIFFIAQNGKN